MHYAVHKRKEQNEQLQPFNFQKIKARRRKIDKDIVSVTSSELREGGIENLQRGLDLEHYIRYKGGLI